MAAIMIGYFWETHGNQWDMFQKFTSSSMRQVQVRDQSSCRSSVQPMITNMEFVGTMSQFDEIRYKPSGRISVSSSYRSSPLAGNCLLDRAWRYDTSDSLYTGIHQPEWQVKDIMLVSAVIRVALTIHECRYTLLRSDILPTLPTLHYLGYKSELTEM